MSSSLGAAGSWHHEHTDLYVALNQPVVSYDALRRSARRGLPEGCGIRPLTWMLLLHAAPLDNALRAGRRAEHLESYWKFVDMFIGESIEAAHANLERKHRVLLTRIQNDINRTMRVHFLFNNSTTHSDALVRILFVFAMLWPQIGYVQGLNEIVGPLYYVFQKDHVVGHAPAPAEVEADTFFAFMNLISKLHFFIEDMDTTSSGIVAIMKQVYEILRELDPQLWLHLTSLGIEPAYYALRWFTTIFTREFSLPDSCRLWDTLFTMDQPEMIPYMQSFSCAMLISVRDSLFDRSHDAALLLLQDYPPTIGMEYLLHVCNVIHSGKVQSITWSPKPDTAVVHRNAPHPMSKMAALPHPLPPRRSSPKTDLVALKIALVIDDDDIDDMTQASARVQVVISVIGHRARHPPPRLIRQSSK
ncbi:hypothetical protein PBRA_006668 [Plasmodiophora brassicae]|uniref:Rab-GAP TBC domain-containing protein n=1 Tax=Plasmodiophora brassicae TaxID=37360 RepID=A0A0G4ITP3_PLABS|nr:hypothetical protein PBRA_006668 [Plasmodiophora brassicae]